MENLMSPDVFPRIVGIDANMIPFNFFFHSYCHFYYSCHLELQSIKMISQDFSRSWHALWEIPLAPWSSNEFHWSTQQ